LVRFGGNTDKHATLSVTPTFFTIVSRVVMQHPEGFIQALTTAPLRHTALPHHVSQFYWEAKQLSRRFAIADSTVAPSAGLLSVFHPQVAASEAALTKTRGPDFHPDFIYPLSPEARRNDRDPTFVQNGLLGFETNWDAFTRGSLSGLNWYVTLHTIFNDHRNNVLAAGGAISACLQPLPTEYGLTRALARYFGRKYSRYTIPYH
jgi:hypothetical protein